MHATSKLKTGKQTWYPTITRDIEWCSCLSRRTHPWSNISTHLTEYNRNVYVNKTYNVQRL